MSKKQISQKIKDRRTVAIIAKEAEKLDTRSNKSSTLAIATIIKIKRLRDADIPVEDIARIVSITKGRVKKLGSKLDEVEIKSPAMKKLAVVVAKEILEGDDMSAKLKIIEKVFPVDEQVQSKQASSVTVNIGEGKDFTNPDKDYIDVETY
jgi:hypothetical protein